LKNSDLCKTEFGEYQTLNPIEIVCLKRNERPRIELFFYKKHFESHLLEIGLSNHAERMRGIKTSAHNI